VTSNVSWRKRDINVFNDAVSQEYYIAKPVVNEM
jgi:hypothetical protein